MGAPPEEGGLIPFELLTRLADPHAVLDGRRLAVVVAHPDDETIGVGGQLARLLGVTVVHVTDGAPRDLRDAFSAGLVTRQAYAEARRQEAEWAMALAGIPRDRLFSFDIVDQEASLQLVTLAARIARFLEDEKITAVLTHAYEGGHPDHDAIAFAMHAAGRLIARSGGIPPALIEMAGYHAGEGGMVTHAFLPGGDPGLTLRLTRVQREAKRRILACYRTQAAILAPFDVEVERLRPAPAYDFARAPHAGPLWYERHGWGWTGGRWRCLAAAALRELDLQGAEHLR